MPVKSAKKPVAPPKVKAPALVPVVVTTKHKGVFFGYGTPKLEDNKRIVNARMCVYWSTSNKGVMGLASNGPDSNARVSLAVPAITLNDITAVMECSPEAAKAWEKGPWS